MMTVEAPREKYRVGVLGGAGSVGQRFVQLLDQHPWFELCAIGGRSLQATKWRLETPIPEKVADVVILPCFPVDFKKCHCSVIFSALDSAVAAEIESAFAAEGFAVFSNAMNHRYDEDVPILIPYVNSEHLEMIQEQQTFSQNRENMHLWKKRNMSILYAGFIVTNANCTTTGLVIALKPLWDAFDGLEEAIVATLQAVSGAGYPGVSSIDILGNVIPYIKGEEEKIAIETAKILGNLGAANDSIHFSKAPLNISAMCHRVPTIDGHLISVSVRLKNVAGLTKEDIVKKASETWSRRPSLSLPSAAHPWIYLSSEESFPQPRLHLNRGKVVHNTILGAAGGSVLNAELAHDQGFLRHTV